MIADWLSVMLEALELRGRIEWVRDVQHSLDDFGWGNVNVEDLGGLSAGEIGQILHDSGAMRMVKSSGMHRHRKA